MNLEYFNILIVEDEIIASEYLKEILLSMGVKHIHLAKSADEAFTVLQNNAPIDIIFMDINIKGSMDGILCAKEITTKYEIPIVFTTAYKDNATIKEASETNIYGYLIKPFSEEEVYATLSIVCKTLNKKQNLDNRQNPDIVQLGVYSYNILNKTVSIHGKTINLTAKEELILSIFNANKNINIPYDVLKQKVWEDKNISPSTIRDTISRLRKKMPELNIQNVSGYGYILGNS